MRSHVKPGDGPQDFGRRNTASLAIFILIAAVAVTLLVFGWWKGYIPYIILFLSTILTASVVIAGSVSGQMLLRRPVARRERNVPSSSDVENLLSSPQRPLLLRRNLTRDGISGHGNRRPRQCLSSPCIRGIESQNDKTRGLHMANIRRSMSDAGNWGGRTPVFRVEGYVNPEHYSSTNDLFGSISASRKESCMAETSTPNYDELSADDSTENLKLSSAKRTRAVSLLPISLQGRCFNVAQKRNFIHSRLNGKTISALSSGSGYEYLSTEQRQPSAAIDIAEGNERRIHWKLDVGTASDSTENESIRPLSSSSDIQNDRGLCPADSESPLSTPSLVPSFWKAEAISPSVTPYSINPSTPAPGLSGASSISPSYLYSSDYKRSYLLEAFLASSLRSSETELINDAVVQDSTKEFLPICLADKQHKPRTTSKSDLTEVVAVPCNERETVGEEIKEDFMITNPRHPPDDITQSIQASDAQEDSSMDAKQYFDWRKVFPRGFRLVE
ncbi:uncharacterized protein LOC135383634 [Ornithodoros turicata]|uniref:uncharacterized protein LOC135383634 n=1 Tax=Ornithodoros turicata TaxID=34597 RepID=UPI003139CB39